MSDLLIAVHKNVISVDIIGQTLQKNWASLSVYMV